MSETRERKDAGRCPDCGARLRPDRFTPGIVGHCINEDCERFAVGPAASRPLSPEPDPE